MALKDLMTALGSPNLDCRQDGAKLDAPRGSAISSIPTIAGIEQADALLLVGTNPRWEAPVINARIRKRWLKGEFPVAAVGAKSISAIAISISAPMPATLKAIADGRHPFAQTLKDAKQPMLIVGQGALPGPTARRSWRWRARSPRLRAS